jgi:hypothetical protein
MLIKARLRIREVQRTKRINIAVSRSCNLASGFAAIVVFIMLANVFNSIPLLRDHYKLTTILLRTIVPLIIVKIIIHDWFLRRRLNEMD